MLTVEESTFAYWVSQTLVRYVDQIVICDPRANALISTSAKKSDSNDTRQLCRLLRLGEIKHVYKPVSDHNAMFKSIVQQYAVLNKERVRIKNQIKAKYRFLGIMDVDGKCVYHPEKRKEYLSKIKQANARNILLRFYALLDETENELKNTYNEIKTTAKRFPQINEFCKIPGVGILGASVFFSYIQTPERFQTKQQLWRYCKLGVYKQESGGNVKYCCLDRSGNSALKAMSFCAFLGSSTEGNEVRAFYTRSLEKTKSRTHARLNTQRKILLTMWTIWKKGEKYKPELFLNLSN